MEKKFFSVREAAFYSGLSGRLLYQKCKDRELRHYRLNSKIIIKRSDLEELIIQNEVVTSEQLLKKIKEKRK